VGQVDTGRQSGAVTVLIIIWGLTRIVDIRKEL
jgi:hypothetical protein